MQEYWDSDIFGSITVESVWFSRHFALCSLGTDLPAFLVYPKTAIFEAHLLSSIKPWQLCSQKVTRFSLKPPIPLLHPRTLRVSTRPRDRVHNSEMSRYKRWDNYLTSVLSAPPSEIAIPFEKFRSRWGWVLLEQMRILSGIQFTTHFIYFFCCGNETNRWWFCKCDLDAAAANLRPALEQGCGKQTPSARKLFLRMSLLYVSDVKM